VAVKHKSSPKASGKRRTPTRSSKKAAPPGRTKLATGKPAGAKKPMSVGDEEVTIDRRRGNRRDHECKPAVDNPAAPEKLERRQKVNRRRQIDPTTCERDYTEQEVEFMNALDEYKRRSGRMFPTCSEVLEVIRSLGYVKASPAESVAGAESDTPITSAKPLPADWPQPEQAANCHSEDGPAATQPSA
jgi:hypothetical protein